MRKLSSNGVWLGLVALGLVGWVGAVAQTDPGANTAQTSGIQATTSGDFPVNLFTGTASIGLPLYSASGRTLSVPVALSYKTTGIRVSQLASPVGLGWSLEVGGVITRIVKGDVDTYSCSGGTCSGGGSSEADVYYFSFLGASGKFYFANGWTYDENPYGAAILTAPISQLRIEAKHATSGTVSDIEEFIVTTEEGTRFIFGQNVTGYGNARERSRAYVNGVPKDERTTAWYLTRIEAADFSDVILLGYENYTISTPYYTSTAAMYRTGLSTFFTNQPYATTLTTAPTAASPQPTGITQPCTLLGNQEVGVETYTTALTQGVRLKQIYFTTGRLEFVYGFDRCDLKGDKALTEVQLKNSSGTLINKTVLAYTHVLAAGATTVCLTGHNDGVRLRLESVTQQSSTGNLVTSFTYNNTPLPYRNSKAQDWWGFANGATGNTTWVGGTATKAQAYPAAEAGTLTQIRYPLGAKTVFEFEAHQATTGAVGGLRLKRMTVQPDGDSSAANNIVREYRYTTYSGGLAQAASSGVEVYRNGFSFEGHEIKSSTSASYRGVAKYSYQYWTSARQYGSDTHIEYATVAELRGAGGVNGLTVSNFLTQGDGQCTYPCQDVATSPTYVGFGGVPKTSYDFLRGQVTQVRLYDMTTPATPTLVQQTTYTWPSYNDLRYYRHMASPTAMVVAVGGTLNQFGRAYGVGTGWRYLSQVEGLTPAQDGTSPSVTSKTVYSYTDRQAVAWTETYGSAGEIQGTELRYSGDYTTTGATAEPALAIGQLQALGRRNIPIEALTYRKDGVGGAKYYTGGAVSHLKRITVNGVAAQGSQSALSGTAVVSDKAYGLRLSQPLAAGSFTPSSISGGNLVVDSRYEVAATLQDAVTSRNAFGQPTEVLHANGSKSALIYGHTSTRVVATFANAGLNQVAYTGFEEGSNFGGWTYTVSYTAGLAKTGANSHSIAAGALSKANLPAGAYWVSLWQSGASTPQTVTVSNGTVAQPTLRTYGTWQLIEWRVVLTSTGTITVSGTSGAVDDVRLFPEGALCSTVTYNPNNLFEGPSAQAGPDNLPLYTFYDDLGRTTLVKDFEGNILQHTEYKIGQ